MKKNINKLWLLTLAAFMMWLSAGSAVMAQEKLIRSLNNTNSLAIINPSLVDTIWFVEGANESADGTAGLYRWIPGNTTTADNRISFTSRFTGAPAGRFISVVPNLWMFNTGQFTATTNQISLAASLTMTNLILAPGTAGQPAIGFTGDTNTGVYSSGDGFVSLVTNGTNYWNQSSTGRWRSALSNVIEVATGDLSITSLAGNGNIYITPNGPGEVLLNKTSADSVIRVQTFTSGVGQFNLEGFSATTYSGSSAAGGALQALRNKDATANNFTQIAFQDASGSNIGSISSVAVSDVNNEGYLAFATRPSGGTLTHNLSVLSDGNTAVLNGNGLIVGNTTQVSAGGITPESQVLGTASNDSAYLSGRFSADGDIPRVTMLKSRSATIGGFTIVQNGDGLGDLSWYADDGADYGARGANIGALVDGTPGLNDMPTRLTFSTAADGANDVTEHLRISADGNVSVQDNDGLIIGGNTQVTADSSLVPEFQVLGTGASDTFALAGRFSADANQPRIGMLKSRAASPGSFAIVSSGDALGNINWYADDGTDYATIAASIHAAVDGTPGANDMPGRLVFSTTADGAASQTEALRINNTQTVVLSAVTELAYTPSTEQVLAVGDPILANATKLRVAGSGGSVTLTSTPTIANGASDGQIVYIQGSSANTVTVQDEGGLAGSNLELGAATRLIGQGDILVLMFDSTLAVWFEVSFANN